MPVLDEPVAVEQQDYVPVQLNVGRGLAAAGDGAERPAGFGRDLGDVPAPAQHQRRVAGQDQAQPSGRQVQGRVGQRGHGLVPEDGDELSRAETTVAGSACCIARPRSAGPAGTRGVARELTRIRSFNSTATVRGQR